MTNTTVHRYSIEKHSNSDLFRLDVVGDVPVGVDAAPLVPRAGPVAAAAGDDGDRVVVGQAVVVVGPDCQHWAAGRSTCEFGVETVRILQNVNFKLDK